MSGRSSSAPLRDRETEAITLMSLTTSYRPLAQGIALASAAALTAAVLAWPLATDAKPDSALRHVGSFFVPENLLPGDPADAITSAEIVDITDDGKMLIYSDALAGRIGFVDISDPTDPIALGALDIPGDPTSLAIHRRWVLVAVNTSEDPDGDGPLNKYDDPSGELLVIDLATRTTVRTIDLGGQPDAIAVSPNGGRYAAIVIENERDEDENDGLIPQPPAGFLQVLDLAGQPKRWSLRKVELTGLAEVAPSDPEPEFVDINGRNQAVITLQENNHLVIVDLRKGTVINHFSAGTVDISDVDTTEEELGPQGNGLIELTGSLQDRRREPDAVAWIDNERFATANEGDYEDENGEQGGSRSFTIFDIGGNVLYEAGNSFEHAVVRSGHYPEGRSENKGSEPEGLEVGRYKGRTYLFVGSERGNIVGVYDVTKGTPTMTQLLPTGMGPEGLKFIRGGLLAVTSEVDGFDDGFAVRPIITLFQAGAQNDWSYPQIESGNDTNDLPIPWVAMSGLSGAPSDPDTLWAVSDSFLAQAWLYRIDVSVSPAVIRERIAIGGIDVADQADGDYDLEGVAARPEGGFWLASEGRTNVGSSRPNLIIRTDTSGTVLYSVPLPASLVAEATSSGFEGVAVTGSAAGEDEVVWTVIQREWKDDPAGKVKIGRYDVADESWTFAHYPLDAVESPAGGWVGLSEITALPDGRMAIVERDNQLGQEARIKRIYGIDPLSLTFTSYEDELRCGR
jgi:DNA-binding beta-propeller fold protein YncE